MLWLQVSSSKGSDKLVGNWDKPKAYGKQHPLCCYLCNSPNHLARDCQARKSESKGKGHKDNKMIRTRFHSDSERESRCVKVKVEGVSVIGLIDTGSDITIIRGDLLHHILSTAGLESTIIRPARQRACAYDQKPITLDGEVDVNISFGEKTFGTTVYIKFVAPDKLLLSEAVCHRLGVVTYHPEVQAVQRSPPKVILRGTIFDERDTTPPASSNEEVKRVEDT